MSWIKNRWQTVALLMLATAAIAVPAWASGGGGSVQPAPEPSGAEGSVERAPAASQARQALPLPPPLRREDLDQGLECMAERGFGMGSATHRGGVLIPRAETKTKRFRDAAKECELPPPPTDAQIHRMACGEDWARRDPDA
jgi:hypothetical protein